MILFYFTLLYLLSLSEVCHSSNGLSDNTEPSRTECVTFGWNYSRKEATQSTLFGCNGSKYL